MVVIDDFRKQILYQKLNLGYECTFCKKKFYSKREQLQHLQEFHLKPQRKDNFKCSQCGKVFGHVQIYQLHQQIHVLSEPDAKCPTAKCNGNEPKNDDNVSSIATAPSSSKQKQRTAAKKAVGLTKIKMEDCLRCDECSCIYIDENDYYKHMRNFHKVDTNATITSITTTTKPVSVTRTSITADPATSSKATIGTKICKTCCKYCRFSKEVCRHQHLLNRSDKVFPRSLSDNDLFRFSMQDNIKNRWCKMVSRRLQESKATRCEDIKIEPPDSEDASYCDSIMNSEEMSHLLSQVEVKIKTEPLDDR